MKFIKIKLVIFIIIFPTLLDSCGTLNCGGPREYIISGFSVDLKRLNGEDINPLVHTYSYNFYLFINKDFNLLTLINLKNTGGYSAFACEPPTDYEPLNPIENIEIKALEDIYYSDDVGNIKRGQNINFLFETQYYSDFIPQSWYDFQYILIRESLRLNLKEGPSKELDLMFNIIITLSDGSIYDFEKSVKLK